MKSRNLGRHSTSLDKLPKKLAVNHPALTRLTYGLMPEPIKRLVSTPSRLRRAGKRLSAFAYRVKSLFNVGPTR